ncbi:hypothetical protein ACFWN2_07165 [Lentzea sp. NPDC058436]|uniref:hypothetical protein n=1 Tax=Lentzea sp. NPDC058436 TaxID=3346499 RepID=UPI00365C5AC4
MEEFSGRSDLAQVARVRALRRQLMAKAGTCSPDYLVMLRDRLHRQDGTGVADHLHHHDCQTERATALPNAHVAASTRYVLLDDEATQEVKATPGATSLHAAWRKQGDDAARKTYLVGFDCHTTDRAVLASTLRLHSTLHTSGVSRVVVESFSAFDELPDFYASLQENGELLWRHR